MSRHRLNSENSGWNNYVQWSKLSHVKEIITLDTNLADVTFSPDMEIETTYQYAVTIQNGYFTYCYNDLDYVLSNNKESVNYHVLAVVLNPTKNCEKINLKNFSFIGYDLLDQSNDTSALTNCGGLNNAFSPSDLNEFGLINEFDKAYAINKKLFDEKPEEYHADTNMWALWRYNTPLL